MIRVSSFGLGPLELRDLYIQRIQRMMPFTWKEIALKRCGDRRTATLLPEEKKFLESEKHFIVLDAKGQSMNSDEFMQFCFQADRHFVVGPAIGFHEQFFKAASGCVSLSRLTFTHGLAQTMLAEALYRATCQMKNHPFVK